jgi:hypothetical protein
VTDEEASAAADKLMATAKSLGLHGFMFLSPVCESCGMVHDWKMLSDLGQHETAEMLDHWREVVDADDPDYRGLNMGAFTQ